MPLRGDFKRFRVSFKHGITGKTFNNILFIAFDKEDVKTDALKYLPDHWKKHVVWLKIEEEIS